MATKYHYRISSYSFRGNYSFLNLEIQRSQYIRPKVTVYKCAETIQGRKLYEEIRYVDEVSCFSVKIFLKKCGHNAFVICLFWTEKLKSRGCTSGMLNAFFPIIRKSKWTVFKSNVKRILIRKVADSNYIIQVNLCHKLLFCIN